MLTALPNIKASKGTLIEDCIHTEVPCKYQKLGCSVKMKRGAGSHENEDKLYLHMVIEKIITMEEELAALKSKRNFSIQNRKFRSQNEVFFHHPSTPGSMAITLTSW